MTDTLRRLLRVFFAAAFLAAPWLVATTPARAQAAALEAKPADPYFEKFAPLKAPKAEGLYLKPGDRLAIVGDSITEQKQQTARQTAAAPFAAGHGQNVYFPVYSRERGALAVRQPFSGSAPGGRPPSVIARAGLSGARR